MNLWEVPPERRGRQDVGRRHRRVDQAVAPGQARQSARRGSASRSIGPELRWLIIRKTLERIGQDRPMLLWLDDLHYASPTTFEGLTPPPRRAEPGPARRGDASHRGGRGRSGAATRIERAARGLRRRAARRGAAQPARRRTRCSGRRCRSTTRAGRGATAQQGQPPLRAPAACTRGRAAGTSSSSDGQVLRAEARRWRCSAATTAELWEERLARAARGAPSPARARPPRSAATSGATILRALLTCSSPGGPGDRVRCSAPRSSSPAAIACAGRTRCSRSTSSRSSSSSRTRPASSAPPPTRSGRHPAATSRRILRHRRGQPPARRRHRRGAAALLHAHVARTGRARATSRRRSRDLAVLDGKLPGGATAPGLRGGGTRGPADGDAPRDAAALARRGAAAGGEALRRRGATRRTRGASSSKPATARTRRTACACSGTSRSDLGAEAQGRRSVARRTRSSTRSATATGGRSAGCSSARSTTCSASTRGRGRCSRRGAAVHGGRRSARPGAVPAAAEHGRAGQRRPRAARALLTTAHADFDAIGYRLGLAQCDLALSHADHRVGNLRGGAASGARGAASFRDVAQPARRGRVRAPPRWWRSTRARRSSPRSTPLRRQALRAALGIRGAWWRRGCCSRRSRSTAGTRSSPRAPDGVRGGGARGGGARQHRHLTLGVARRTTRAPSTRRRASSTRRAAAFKDSRTGRPYAAAPRALRADGLAQAGGDADQRLDAHARERLRGPGALDPGHKSSPKDQRPSTADASRAASPSGAHPHRRRVQIGVFGAERTPVR